MKNFALAFNARVRRGTEGMVQSTIGIPFILLVPLAAFLGFWGDAPMEKPFHWRGNLVSACVTTALALVCYTKIYTMVT